jgi:hypothetical protein
MSRKTIRCLASVPKLRRVPAKDEVAVHPVADEVQEGALVIDPRLAP